MRGRVPRGERARGRRPGLAAASAVTMLAALLTGCGIRASSVPTDFGPAPSRAPCTVSGSDIAPEPGQGIPAQVYLVCASRLVAVDRTVRIPADKDKADDRVVVAQSLLDQLQLRPSAPELQAGYTTDLRGGMTVTGARQGDPQDALRLGTPPRELTAYALAQIVCTFADSAAAAEDGSVVLGGPGAEPLRRYQCTPEVRSRPGTTTPPASSAGQG